MTDIPKFRPADAIAATGGPPASRHQHRQWFCTLLDPISEVVDGLAHRDPLGRTPIVRVFGADEVAMRDMLAARCRAMTPADESHSLHDAVVMIDHLTGRLEANSRAALRGALGRVRPGGRVLIVDRVVSERPDERMSIDELLQMLAVEDAGRLVLDDITSFVRPGETTRSTVLLSLVRLGAGRGGSS